MNPLMSIFRGVCCFVVSFCLSGIILDNMASHQNKVFAIVALAVTVLYIIVREI